MKKIFLFAMAAVLLMAGCVKEEISHNGNDGKVQVTFTANLPIEASRALVGDGSKVNELNYAIYDDAGELFASYPYENDVEVIDNHATVTLDLVKGQSYKIAFWAQHSDAPYTFDRQNGVVTVDYSGTVLSNDEKFDAFYVLEPITVTGPDVKTVTLRRPFAQINLGATKADVDAAKALGIVIDKTKVTLSGVNQTLELFSGKAKDKTTAVVNFDYNALPGNDLTVNSVDYAYLAANYILANGDADVTELEFVVRQGSDDINTVKVPAVNYKRNYRTNILGRLLTSSVDFNIVIDGTPDGDLGSTWDGTMAVPFYDEPTKTYSVSTPNHLAWIAAAANGTLTASASQNSTRAGETLAPETFKGKTIKLTTDIDLAGEEWTPIGNSANKFQGTFDGQGYSIKNLVITSGNDYVGLFGFTTEGVIKNLVVENAQVKGRVGTGVVAGSPYTSKYQNITVKGHVEVDGMAYVGTVGGRNAYANWDRIVVDVDDTSYVNANSVENGIAYRSYVGGVIGFMGEGGHTVSNVKSNIYVKGSTCDVGGIVGIAHYGNSFVNCVCTGDVEIYAAEAEADVQEIGGIAGVWMNSEANSPVTFTNCKFEGELIANNNYVINTNRFGNLVCAAYNANGSGKLIIDGVEYSQTSEGVIIDGASAVEDSEDLVAALEAGKDVVLVEDVKIDPAGMSNAYGTTGINVKNGQTIDGGGHVLDIAGAGGTWDSGISTTGGIIKNIKITGSFRGIFINHNSDTYQGKVVLEYVIIDGTTYTISCDQGTNNGLEATNSTFKGWTSYAATLGEAKFNNCYFGFGNGYKFCRPYAPTVFNGCTFEVGYNGVDCRAKCEFINCKMSDGTAITAENI
ncbi:MAG: hypothetical protein IJB08_06280, partial [Alistipes sp.]|nr:hypothetical protein [Alistipes sp.]